MRAELTQVLNDKRPPKNSITARMLLLLTLLIGGCRSHRDYDRRSIEDLFVEAQQSAAARPDIIFSTVSATHDGLNSAEVVGHLSDDAPDLTPEELLPSSDGDSVLGNTEKISESFEQTDIREAIQILADYGQHSVIVDETVGGVTSAQIKDESFEQALEKVLMPLGLVYVKRDKRYLIAPPDPDSPLFSYVAERTQYSPKYHDITSLVELLPARFKQFLQSSKDRNIAIIDAPKVIATEIIRRLQEIDKPVAQVELEAIVCVVAPDKGFRFGLDWGHVVGVSGVDSLKAGMTGLTFSGQISPSGARNAFSDFAITSAFVRLLAQEGYVTIRAAPRVTARDGEKAHISIQRETFFSLQPSNSNVLFRQDVQKVDSGISLEIIPRIHGDIVNVLIEKAEVSEDLRASDSRPELTSNPYPIINRRQVSTEVNVRNGNTIVIGGLVQRQTVDRVNRVPFLSQIPWAGNLFKTVEKQEQDAEVAIFISPRIVPAEMCTIP